MSKVEQLAVKQAARVEGNGAEPTIEQVRELLFGHTQRSNDKRADETDRAIEALRKEMQDRFAALEARMEEALHDSARRHANTVDAIGSAIADLGANVRKLAEPAGRK